MSIDRLKPRSEDLVRVREPELRRCVTAILERSGLTPEDAAEAADVLVMTDLRGVETHGVSNMLRIYVREYRGGGLNAKPGWLVDRETPATAVIDAEMRLGLVVAARAMRLAIEKAKKVGLGAVSVRNAGHFGAMGHHALLAADAGMVGLAYTAVRPWVVPTFAAKAMLGTNPIAIAAPARHEATFLFDAATSVVAGNQVRLAIRLGEPLSPGWVAEHDGTPVTEPAVVQSRKDFLLLPLGSTREQGSHKGYGLGMMVEVLCTLLGGAVPTMLDPGAGATGHFLAYDIEAFTSRAQFEQTMDRMLEALRTAPPAPGHERVLHPGLPEHEAVLDNTAHGIPLHREVVGWFQSITSELGVPPLVTL